MPALASFFYHSTLAPGESVACVSTIIKRARVSNAANNITGLLVFDGQNFLQYVEGPASKLLHLVKLLQSDQRHTGFTFIAEPAPLPRRHYSKWAMGYVLTDALGFIESIACLPPGEALTRLMASHGMLDTN